MTKCKRCERATDLFVCKACIAELRKRLADLRWWIDRLTETAVGQANLGDGARKGERRDVLHGDDTLVSHVEPFPATRTPPRPPGTIETDTRRRCGMRWHSAGSTDAPATSSTESATRCRRPSATCARRAG